MKTISYDKKPGSVGNVWKTHKKDFEVALTSTPFKDAINFIVYVTHSKCKMKGTTAANYVDGLKACSTKESALAFINGVIRGAERYYYKTTNIVRPEL